MQGHILIAGTRPTPEVLALMLAEAAREGVELVVADPDAPDFLPNEDWNSYASRCGHVEPPAQSKYPIPQSLLRRAKR